MTKKKKKARRVQRPRGVTVVALWLFFSAIPGIYKIMQQGIESILSPQATLDSTYIVCAILITLGLLFMKEWARKGAIWFFVVYGGWAVFNAYQIFGSSFGHVVNVLSVTYMASLELTRYAIIALMIAHVFWPVMALLYLTFPGTRNKFDPAYIHDNF